MARIARVVAPGYPHHVIQRGNRRQRTFFQEDDYQAYLALMGEWCRHHHVQIWGYCLMPNHVHLIAVPETAEGLALAVGEAHRRYTRRINFREDWRGHLWQGRFASYVMDERHLLACARYIELNPVRAGLVREPEDWPWSSVHFHVKGSPDVLIKEDFLPKMVGVPWNEFLSGGAGQNDQELFRKHERTGRPCGDSIFLEQLENLLGRELKLKKTGPKAVIRI